MTAGRFWRPALAIVVLVNLAFGCATGHAPTRPVPPPPPGVEATAPKPAPAPVAGAPASRAGAPPSKPVRPRQQEQTVRVGRLQPSGGYAVVEVPLEEYVARVLAGEAAPRSAPAALEAVAIAVRTFAVANQRRHADAGFDLCDQTHCQVMATATAATRAAAEATAGRILLYADRPASVFFTGCCGGRSELPEDVWPRAARQPFLKRHKEPQCRNESAWTTEIAAADLLRSLRAAGFRGTAIRKLRVARRSASGRAAVLQVQGLQPAEITGDNLRLAVGRTLGWQYMKSTAFDVKRTRTTFQFSGHGSGHGVGLCLVGAARMASEGKSAAKILVEYFPGTTIGIWGSRP
jgi:stage II sporulation protein D